MTRSCGERDLTQQVQPKISLAADLRQAAFGIEQEQRSNGASPLVTVHERMVADDRMEECGGSLIRTAVDWFAKSRLKRPRARRIQRGGVLASRTAPYENHLLVDQANLIPARLLAGHLLYPFLVFSDDLVHRGLCTLEIELCRLLKFWLLLCGHLLLLSQRRIASYNSALR